MFILFAGDNYYPSGGASDSAGQYATLAEAKAAAAVLQHGDWYHIYDVSKDEIVDEGVLTWEKGWKPK